MHDSSSPYEVTTQVTIQGGGYLQDVSNVVKVDIEQKEVVAENTGNSLVKVAGMLEAEVHYERLASKEVQSEVMSIPFSESIDTPTFPAGPVQVDIENIESDYRFDPVSGQFNHTISLGVRIRHIPAETVSAEESINKDEAYNKESHNNSGEPEKAGTLDTKIEPVSDKDAKDDHCKVGPGKIEADAKSEANGVEEKKTPERDVLVWTPFPSPINDRDRA